MNRIKLCLLTVCLLFLLANEASAQKGKTQKPVKKAVVQKPPVKKTAATKTETKKPEKAAPVTSGQAGDSTQNVAKVRDMVAFLEYMLNTLGSESTSSRDKDVLITESYSKIFKDGNVQVEDDLDDEREVITNKNVVAYLKDVDFFFTDVKFEFIIDRIQRGTNSNNKLFYKVSLKRNLKGTTSDGKAINNTTPRFIEVNYNPDDQDLKIASIYTHEFSEKDALINWWKQLSLEWKNIFKGKLLAAVPGKVLPDSLAATDIKDITSIEILDLSNDKYIQNIDPLGQLTGLKTLRLAGTNIGDLNPIRNLTELVELDLSNTKTADLSPLKYSSKLTRLNISHTDVADISVLQKMNGIQILDVSNTKVTDFSFLSNLTGLAELNLALTKIQGLSPIQGLIQLTTLKVSSTPVEDLTPLKNLKNLKILTVDSTRISDIAPLSGSESLTILNCNFTLISDLTPVLKLAHLERIYCDKSKVDRAIADAFMRSNPKILVVFDSEDLNAWWGTLTGDWQEVFARTSKIGVSPTKDELARLTAIDSINFAGSHIDNLTPLSRLLKLRVVIANNTAIVDLMPLRELKEIVFLDVHETDVSDISVLSKLPHLKELRADKTKIERLDPLFGLASLKKLYVDQTAIHDITAVEFLEMNPRCLLVYKTIHLNRWWNKLTDNWREVFRGQLQGDTTSSRENLHKLVEQEALHFKEAPVSDLAALSEFIRLNELQFSSTAITDLSPLANFKSLKSLHATHGPLQNIETLNQLTELEDLDISDTPIDELRVLGSLDKLKKLNCSGTQIKKLDPLKLLPALENLDCSNTRVGNLDPVSHKSLKLLKCYNTKVSTREIENFKRANAGCNVVYYR